MKSTTTGGAFAARSWPIRLLRAFTATAVSVILAIAGHRFGGGDVVAPGLLALVSAGVLVLAFLLGNRKVTTGQIFGLLLLGQIAVHAACMTGGESMSLGSSMLIGHLVATVIATAILQRGEAFLWTLADRLGLERLRLLFRRAAVPVARIAVLSTYDVVLPRLNPRAGGIVLRGPPVGCA